MGIDQPKTTRVGVGYVCGTMRARLRCSLYVSTVADSNLRKVIARSPIRETSSHATRRGTLVQSRLGLLSICGLIPGLRRGVGSREIILT